MSPEPDQSGTAAAGWAHGVHDVHPVHVRPCRSVSVRVGNGDEPLPFLDPEP